MLDRVAFHLPIRTDRNGTGTDLDESGANRILDLAAGQVIVYDIGLFENCLHEDPKVRHQIHEHIKRGMRAAALLKQKGLGVKGITLFVGRNPKLTVTQNLRLFETEIIPLIKFAKSLGLVVYFENCPMCGWNTRSLWVNNLAHSPGMWYALYLIAKKHEVADSIFITYDASHDSLQMTCPSASFAFMKAAGAASMLDRFHGKDLIRNPGKVAAWTGRGKTAMRGDERLDGEPADDPAAQLAAWGEMIGDHGMVCVKHYNPRAQIEQREIDWVLHQVHARTILGLNPSLSVMHMEHEFNPCRTQDREMIEELLILSAEGFRAADQLADTYVRSAEWAKTRKIALPNQPYVEFDNIPGLDAEILAIRQFVAREFDYPEALSLAA